MKPNKQVSRDKNRNHKYTSTTTQSDHLGFGSSGIRTFRPGVVLAVALLGTIIILVLWVAMQT